MNPRLRSSSSPSSSSTSSASSAAVAASPATSQAPTHTFLDMEEIFGLNRWQGFGRSRNANAATEPCKAPIMQECGGGVAVFIPEEGILVWSKPTERGKSLIHATQLDDVRATMRERSQNRGSGGRGKEKSERREERETREEEETLVCSHVDRICGTTLLQYTC